MEHESLAVYDLLAVTGKIPVHMGFYRSISIAIAMPIAISRKKQQSAE